jgi:hypothetical protein
MNAPPSTATRVRWLVCGPCRPVPSGRAFLLTEDTFARQLGDAARGLSVTTDDRIGSGDAQTHNVSFDGLRAFGLAEVVSALPGLHALRALHTSLLGATAWGPEEAAHLRSVMGTGRLAATLYQALQGAPAPQAARRSVLTALEEALFGTALDVLQHPKVAPLESTWRGLHWLWTHCPPAAGMDIGVLDTGSDQLLKALEQCLDVPPLERPDACFILDAGTDSETLHPLAALGEQAAVPMVFPAPPTLATGQQEPAWSRLRADEASRWLGAALNPVVLASEQQGAVRRECFGSPVLAVAALLAASFRDTRTFARVVGPGSGTKAPAVWQPRPGSKLATEAGLSLREQQRLAAQGVLGVSGWWDSDAVQLAAAPTVYAGRDATTLAAQLLTGRIVRLAQEVAGRLPPDASPDAVAAVFSRAGEVFLPTGSGRDCQLQGRVVSAGRGERAVHVRASLRPELAGTHVQLELTLPLTAAAERM